MNFHELHHQQQPLILANIWDVPSAKTAELLDFQAIGTSSMAMAHMLGYEDGEHIPFETIFLLIDRIKQATSIPLTVDLEAGYSRHQNQIIEHIEKLVDIGVSGINIEDSLVNEERKLVDETEFASLVRSIKQHFGEKLFINVRTDTYLLNVDDVLQQTLSRIQSFQNSGADGIFIPCLTSKSDIKMICQSTSLPINVMSMPDLPDFKTLQALGVKRLSMGSFAFETTQKRLSSLFTNIQNKHSFKELFI